MSSISDFCNIIIAIATIATIGISIWQLIKTLNTQEKNNIEDSYYSHRYEAFLVDAWIARKNGERRIIIDNESRGAIRDIKIHLRWPALDMADHELDSFGFHVAPKSKKSWRLLPKGLWCIQPAVRPGYASWDLPRADTEGFSLSPAFFEPEASNDRDRYTLISIEFTDLYDNTWRRVYEDDKDLHKIKADLYLIKTSDSRLQRFVSTDSNALSKCIEYEKRRTGSIKVLS